MSRHAGLRFTRSAGRPAGRKEEFWHIVQSHLSHPFSPDDKKEKENNSTHRWPRTRSTAFIRMVSEQRGIVGIQNTSPAKKKKQTHCSRSSCRERDVSGSPAVRQTACDRQGPIARCGPRVKVREVPERQGVRGNRPKTSEQKTNAKQRKTSL